MWRIKVQLKDSYNGNYTGIVKITTNNRKKNLDIKLLAKLMNYLVKNEYKVIN